MSINKTTKINHLLQTIPRHVVLVSSWLLRHEISYPLQERYLASNWFTSIGKGAYIRSGDKVDLTGGIYALQYQLGLHVHVGAKTALLYQNVSHFLSFKDKKVFIFGCREHTIPSWFKNYFTKSNFSIIKSSFLPPAMGLVDHHVGDFSIKISSKERAILEVLYLCPKKVSLKEAYQLMELLVNLRPTLLQDLFEQCQSIKVKRLFLYMAEKIGHEWFNHLDLNKINIGKGKRVISGNGTLDKKYQIVIEDLEEI